MFEQSPFGMFSIMQFIFPIFFIFVFGMILLQVFRRIKQWNYNNKQPILTVVATVVTKRTHTSRHRHNNHTSSSTRYYVTFEVESGNRIELPVLAKEYGMLVEGDIGKLTFQGTRYHSFERIRESE